MHIRRSVLVLFTVLAFMTSALVGQTYRGAIAGSVADSSGAAVADAVVKVVNKGTALTRTQNTPAAGDFTFPDLAPGIYNISVTRQGFQTYSQDVEVAVGKISSVAVTLGVAAQAQTVDVQAAAVQIESNEAVLNAVVNTRAVQEIPLNGRDFTQLLKLTPGYNDQGSMNGNRANQNNWQIDGADNNDFWHNADAVNQGSISGVAGVLLPIDAIDQFNQQAGGNADFGRNAGSMVNVVIKSGTNSLHGTAYYYNRNEALAAQNPFAPPGVNPELRNEHEGFSLGGPIWKNHTFFFLTFERQKFVQGNTVTATVPSQAWIDQAQIVLNKYHVPVNPVDAERLQHAVSRRDSRRTGDYRQFFQRIPSAVQKRERDHQDRSRLQRKAQRLRARVPWNGRGSGFCGFCIRRIFPEGSQPPTELRRELELRNHASPGQPGSGRRELLLPGF